MQCDTNLGLILDEQQLYGRCDCKCLEKLIDR